MLTVYLLFNGLHAIVKMTWSLHGTRPEAGLCLPKVQTAKLDAEGQLMRVSKVAEHFTNLIRPSHSSALTCIIVSRRALLVS